MNCADVEYQIADYLDGTLSPETHAALEHHIAGCSGCRAFLADVSYGAALLAQAPEVMPPAELITRIAYQAPVGRTRHPLEYQGLFSKLAGKWLQPLLQPRFAMGMAMTILSFAMLERCTGVHVQQIQPSDLNPVRVWGGFEDRALRVKDRAVKYYENIRLVYEVETRFRELEDQQTAAQEDAGRRKRARSANPTNSGNVHGAAASPGQEGNRK